MAADPRTAELDGYSLLDYFKLRTSDEEAIQTLNLAVLPVFGAPAKVCTCALNLKYAVWGEERSRARFRVQPQWTASDFSRSML